MREPISSMPGQFRLSLDEALKVAKEASQLGIQGIAPFAVIPEGKKNAKATESLNRDGIYLRALSELKTRCPELVLFSDVAMDPYSSDGHDGLVVDGKIVNDPTLEILAAMAVAQAQAGADYVSPSDMMDGRIGFIRRALDESNFSETGILAYSAKYASSFYGPFREALDSAPRSGDKKTYQMDPANRREAIREIELDVAEGADMVMIKPAMAYLDVISDVKKAVDIPVVAYQVSGEYAMFEAVRKLGWGNADAMLLESLLGIKRAGADLVLTYAAMAVAPRIS